MLTDNKEEQLEKNEFDTPGERLNHILDQIGFKKGRGRVTEFQAYLTSAAPDNFSDLKYSTVRSWFQYHAPPMRKIDVIIQLLQNDYPFQNDISQIKTWWKVGGYYPFSTDDASSKSGSDAEFTEFEEKMQFISMSLVTEITGDNFSSLSSQDLIIIKDKVIEFAKDYADPYKTECPQKYLRLIIKEELNEIIEKNED